MLLPALLEDFPPRTLPAASLLFEQGEDPKEIFFLHSGSVKLQRIERTGAQVIIQLLHGGRFIGTAAAVLDQPHEATALTCEAAHISSIPKPRLEEWLRTKPNASHLLLLAQSREHYRIAERLGFLATTSARKKVEDFLSSLLTEGDESVERKVMLPLKNWEIASLIAITPEHLSRLLRQMEKEGILLRGRGFLTILRPELLTRNQ